MSVYTDAIAGAIQDAARFDRVNNLRGGYTTRQGATEETFLDSQDRRQAEFENATSGAIATATALITQAADDAGVTVRYSRAEIVALLSTLPVGRVVEFFDENNGNYRTRAKVVDAGGGTKAIGGERIIQALARVVTSWPELQAAIGGGSKIVLAAPITLQSNVSIVEITGAVGSGKLIRNGYTISVTRVEESITAQLWDVGDSRDIAQRGKVTVGQPFARPEWWGDVECALDLAIYALPAAGGTVKLRNRTYKPSYYCVDGASVTTPKVSARAMTKSGVKVAGEKLPRWNDDCSALIDGTVIQGTFLAWADGHEADLFGIDSGKGVVDTYFGGAPSISNTEGYLFTHPVYPPPFQDAGAIKHDAKLGRVIGLCYNQAAPVHAVLLEAGSSIVFDTLIGCYGQHGVVTKAKKITGNAIVAYMNGLEGHIAKSDFDNALCQDNQISRAYLTSRAPDKATPWSAPSDVGVGLMANPAGNSVTSCQYGSVIVRGFDRGFATQNTAGDTVHVSARLSIGQLDVDGCVTAGVDIQQYSQWLQLGQVVAANCPTGFSDRSAVPLSTQVGSYKAINAAIAYQGQNGANTQFGSFSADGCASIFYLAGNARPVIGGFDYFNCTAERSNANGAAVPALRPNWSNVGSGNRSFGILPNGGGVNIRGLVKPASVTGTAGNGLISYLPFSLKPSETERRQCPCFDGTTLSSVHVVFTASGGPAASGVNAQQGGIEIEAVNSTDLAAQLAKCSAWVDIGAFYSLR